MKNEQIKAIKHYLQSSRKMVIVPHRSPDGDAIGSTLALHLYLEKQGHDSLVIAPNNYPHFLKWLPRENDILRFDENREKAEQEIAKAEMIFTLDFNLLSRTGEMEAPLKKATAKFVMIDHHQQPDDYADFMYSDVKASSTCELVFDLLKKMNRTEAISPEMATCLYTGIMTDTGSFRFSSTTSHTHRVVAALIDKGA